VNEFSLSSKIAFAMTGVLPGDDYIPMRDFFTSPQVSFADECVGGVRVLQQLDSPVQMKKHPMFKNTSPGDLPSVVSTNV